MRWNGPGPTGSQCRERVPANDPLRQHLKEAQDAQKALDSAIPGSSNSATSQYPPISDSKGNLISVNDWAKSQGYEKWDDNPADNVGFRWEMEKLRSNVTNDIAATEAKIRDIEGNGTPAEFDQAIANVKSSIDTVNSQSQMDMVRLQGLMDKRNQTFDTIANSLSKFSKSMDSVIGNMR